MKYLGFLLLATLAAWVSPAVLRAVEIEGKVTSADRGVATIQTRSDYVPNIGDAVKIFEVIPGVAEAEVAAGKVSAVADGRIKVKIGRASGEVVVGHLARIQSPNARRRVATSGIRPPVRTESPAAGPDNPEVTPPPIDGPADRFDTLNPQPRQVGGDDAAFYELVRAGKLKQALAEANRVIPADPSDFNLHHLRAERVWLELLIGDPRRAEAEANRLAKVEPGTSTVLSMKGHIALFKNDVQTARQLFADALKQDPTSPKRIFDYGVRLYDRGSWQAAWVQLYTAQFMDPRQTPLAAYYLGSIAEKLGDPTRAIQQYEAFLRGRPEGPQAARARERVRHLRANAASSADPPRVHLGHH